MRFLLLAVEGGGDEHADAHETRIPHFQPHLRGADVGVEDGPDIADPALEHFVRIGVQADVCVLAEADKGKIVLVHVAHDPDIVEVGDGEEVRRIVERLHAGPVRHVLLDDDARDGGVDVDDPARDGDRGP